MNPFVIGVGIIASYFFGTFPSALIVAKRGGIDVTSAGSGNPGTSNVVRLLGWKYGAVVFALDMAKGAIAAVIGWQIDGTRVSVLAYVCVVAAIIGHTYPVTRKFKGGKGVATGGGAMFVLHPAISLVLFTSWFIIRRLTKKSSVASLVISIALPIAVAVDGAEAWEITALVVMVVLIVFRHIGNIQRLRSKQEPSV
ncbi:MAG: glycerol-3-phosphate 1-O-acyltransferase PlsY [Ilumatobacteraceae bacterium]